ncbi:hypothetical protein DMUE_5518 [Dictyocoela muelleri]|nr:hypothetical protein DMUE_5518 [Dictyocoela muelleri]
MRPFKNLSKIRIIELTRYIRTNKQARSILERAGILNKTKNCPVCRKLMKFHDGKREYFYCSRQCKIKVPYKHNNIMQGIKINYKDFIIFAYFYFYKETVTKAIMRNLNFSSTLIVKLKKRIEEKIIIHNKKKSKLKEMGA